MLHPELDPKEVRTLLTITKEVELLSRGECNQVMCGVDLVNVFVCYGFRGAVMSFCSRKLKSTVHSGYIAENAEATRKMALFLFWKWA